MSGLEVQRRPQAAPWNMGLGMPPASTLPDFHRSPRTRRASLRCFVGSWIQTLRRSHAGSARTISRIISESVDIRKTPTLKCVKSKRRAKRRAERRMSVRVVRHPMRGSEFASNVLLARQERIEAFGSGAVKDAGGIASRIGIPAPSASGSGYHVTV